MVKIFFVVEYSFFFIILIFYFYLRLAVAAAVSVGKMEYNPVRRMLAKRFLAKRNIGDGVFQNGIIDIGQLGQPGQASNYFQFDNY